MGDVIKSEEILPVPVERFSKKVVIDNTQVFLTDLHPPEQLIESFQTSKLFIRVSILYIFLIYTSKYCDII